MRRLIALAASGMVLFSAANAFAASQTANLGVGASIPQRCSISAGNLNFNITAGFSSDITTTAQISVSCQGTAPAYSIGINNGQHQSVNPNVTAAVMMGDRNLADNRGNRVPYDVYRDSAHTKRWGQTPGNSASGITGDRASYTDPGAPNFTVYAKIPSVPNAEPGTYSDQLIVTLYY